MGIDFTTELPRRWPSHAPDLRTQFLLRDDVTYLNFGSFGACPKPVFQKYQQYQLELESEPVLFLTDTGLQYLKTSRRALGQYINCLEDDLVFLPNPSHAVNIIAKSFPLKEADEVLATNIEYGACDRTWEYYCNKVGAVYKRQPIRFPIESKEDFIHQFLKGITAKTKLVFISHITSSTGLRLPVEDICRIAKEKGLMTFVDGAHAPGQIPLDMQALDADIYTGACHKWMMTPKGSSFLYVKKEHQHLFDPLVISWGYNALFPSQSQFLDYHQLQGTRDFSAFLTIPDAIQFMKAYSWDEVSNHYKKMTLENAKSFAALLKATPLAPIHSDFILQLYSAQIQTKEPEKLHRHFFTEYKIQIPVMRQNGNVYLRYSLNACNTQADMDKLFDAINLIEKNTNLIEA